MAEYSVIFTIVLRLTGEMVMEAESLEIARAAVQEMLDNDVLDMDYTIYENGEQSEDIFWDQEFFDVGLREAKEIMEDDDEPEKL